MSGLRLKLLGGFELRPASGAPIPLSARKPALLLAYLALRQGQPQGRDKLAGLFWGDSGEAQARASLRQALADLRRRLGPHEGLIQAPEGETVALARDGLTTDVAEFERCLATGGRDALERAAALYEGDLLDGFQAPRQPLLEEWLVAERQRLRERALAAMAALLPDVVAADPPEAGVRLALRILALDPLQEVAHRALMRLHARQGRRGAALARYQMLREALARELGVAPEEETQRLYRELRDQRGTAQDRAAVPDEAPATAAMPARRPLTILACDLWGSDALASRLDLEGMHDLLDLYQQAVVGEISRLEGYVARLAGASVVAWFGWPKALDDAAERAVRAGLAATAAVGRLKGPDGEPLAAQVGIATGPVVVNDPAADGAVGERAVVGAAPVLASGLRTLARPGTVLLSEGTRGLVDGLFELEALGPRRVGELAGEVAPAWRARAARRAEVERVRQASADPRGPESGNVDSPVEPNARGAVPLLARDAELRHLREGLAKALDATRQVVFVTGEPGIGKTALVEAFIGHVALADPAVRIGRGQCLKHRGPGEAYLPILEALDRLCRVPASGDEMIRLLDRHAPTWLAQMPGLLEPAALEALERRNRSATRERMLREMAEAVEAMSAGRPLLLAIEDLQWSDASTIDLLSWLAQRREPARLMVIGTCRPAEAKPDGHPLHATVRELCRQGKATELALAFLDEAAVAEYLRSRLGDALLPAWLPRLLHERTDGNPLFVVDLVESWIAQGLLARTAGAWSLPATPEALAADLPLSLRQLIEQQLNQLAAEDEETLEEASVVGRVFSSALVAAAGERDAEETERRCARLARAGRLIASRGVAEWSDGTIASSYGFVHDLYREVLYDRVPAGRRARLHRRCGACLEQSYGPHALERAAELASHFRRGRDFGRALGYLQLAARQAFRRSAHPEAIAHLDLALDTLRHLSDDGERARAELALQTLRGEILTVTEGWSSRAAESAFLRARKLCRQAPDEPPELARILYGLANLYEFRGEFATSAALMEQCLALPATQDGAAFLQAKEVLACSLYHRGQFPRSLDEAAQGLARYRFEPAGDGLTAGEMAVHLHGWAAMALWFLGKPDQALARARLLLELGRSLDSPAVVAGALAKGAVVHQLRGDAVTTEDWARRALEIATVHGFRYRAAAASILRGWALAARGRAEDGIGLLRDGLAACRETGAEMDRPYYLALLAEACRHAGRDEEGLRAATEGLLILEESRGGQPFFYEAELCRLKACLLPREGGRETEAEALLHRAQAVARQQQSSSLELRAALSSARLRPGRRDTQAVGEIYRRFEEGFDTPDLIEARELLNT